MQRIDTSTADVGRDPDRRLTYKGQPFTGEAVTHGHTGKVTSTVTYVDGVEHGPRRQWYENGPLKAEMFVHHGRIIGTAREWHENGRLAQEQRFNEHGDLVEESRWDENGQTILGAAQAQRNQRQKPVSQSVIKPRFYPTIQTTTVAQAQVKPTSTR